MVVDQSSIGVSARSTPATYLGIMDTVRKIFARETGAEAGFFSFNSSGALAAPARRGIINTDLAFMDPRDDDLRRLRRPALPGRGTAADGRRQLHRRRARDDRRPGTGLLRRHGRTAAAARL
ncbi:hypothetical protein LV779_27935 [Streptomyces thinghirensis]|nr:hypothetical protein [Streptomyces thinghirensis]